MSILFCPSSKGVMSLPLHNMVVNKQCENLLLSSRVFLAYILITPKHHMMSEVAENLSHQHARQQRSRVSEQPLLRHLPTGRPARRFLYYVLRQLRRRHVAHGVSVWYSDTDSPWQHRYKTRQSTGSAGTSTKSGNSFNNMLP